MKIRFAPVAVLAVSSASLWGFSAQDARAASGTVVIVAEGLSPQVLELGKGYLRKADADSELTTAFDELKAKGSPSGAATLADMSGLLQSAHDNGYATGLVTTGDITSIAPLFYNLQGEVLPRLTAKEAPYEFIAGGGAANLPGAPEKIAANGDTFVASSQGLDAELKGRVLAAEAPGDLNYSLDRDPAQESGLGELTTAALDTLGAGDKPFVLVVHDSLLAKALQNHDTPALFEQFREINTIVGDAVARRDDDPTLKIAVLMTEARVVPHFATQSTEEQQDAYSVASNLNQSFVLAGKSLQGKTVEDITAFADPDAGEYKGWKITEGDKAKIADGTLNPETAIRAFYEPLLKLDYATTIPAPGSALTLGFEAQVGLVAGIKKLIATPAK